MIKLKSLLQSKILYFILIILTVIYCFLIIKFNLYNYKISNKNIVGRIIEINNKKDYNLLKLRIGINKYMIIYDYKKMNFKIGDKIKAEGKIIKPSSNTNFHLFNYQRYLKSNNIFYILKAKSIKKVNNSSGVYLIKNYIVNYINKFNNNYLCAFILGDTSDIDRNIKESYKKNGISHLFAISGLHVSIFVIIISLIFKKLLKFKYDYIIIILFLLFYLFLTNFTKSITRTTSLYILNIICKKTNFNINIKKLIILILCMNLIINPYNIYNIGFIFSYTISISLIFNKQLLDNCTNYIKKLLLTSVICFLTSIPILINNSFELNFLSIILNLIYVPFVSFIVFPLSLLTLLLPPLNAVLNFTLLLLENSSLILSNIDFLKFNFCHISSIIVFFYYFFIYLFIIGIEEKRYLLFIPLIILMIIHYNYPKINSNQYYITLDVGQGDCSLLIYPNSKSNILIDTGGNYNNDIASNIIIPSLTSYGIKKINYLIITHGDFDHMGEAINLVENFKVEKVIFNCGPYNDLEQELINVLDKKKIKYYSCIKELNIDKNKLQFLQTKEYDNENDNSNVIYTELDGYKFMFMGDAFTTTEKEIMSNYNLPDIDVLKVGHHGSKTSSSKEFINEINPKYSIISVGKNNRYGHPNKEVLNTLENSKIYRTDQDGSIMFKIKNNKLKIETCSP